MDIETVLKSYGGFGKNLGIEFAELTPKRVVPTMPVDERHHQPFGYLHGGRSAGARGSQEPGVGGSHNR